MLIPKRTLVAIAKRRVAIESRVGELEKKIGQLQKQIEDLSAERSALTNAALADKYGVGSSTIDRYLRAVLD